MRISFIILFFISVSAMIYRDIYDIEYEFYDEFYDDYIEDVVMYRKIVEKYFSKDARVLDLMCGTGRIMRHFLDYSEVWGIDINDRMLEVARRKLESNKNVKIIKMDALKMHLETYFEAIIIGLNSIMLFPRQERKILLRNVSEHLRKGGILIGDLWRYIDVEDNVLYHGDTKEIGGNIVSRFFTVRRDGEKIRVLYFYDIVSNDILRRKCASINLHIIDEKDLYEDLMEAGMKIRETYGDYDFSRYDDSSDKLIFVAEKI